MFRRNGEWPEHLVMQPLTKTEIRTYNGMDANDNSRAMAKLQPLARNTEAWLDSRIWKVGHDCAELNSLKNCFWLPVSWP